MNSDRFQRASELFDRARRRPAGDRRAWLARAAGGDRDLHDEVLSLLAEHEGGEGLMATVVEDSLSAAEAIPARLGAFRLLREVGTGGMGTVYLAAKVGEAGFAVPEDRVAVKRIHPHLLGAGDFERRFLREAEVGRRVRHENVVRTYGTGVEAEGPPARRYLVMEYVEGQTLRTLLEDLGWVPEELCRHIGREVASGLAAIHEAGAVHRDLKPDNVLLTRDDVVKVMDLGVARIADAAWDLSGTGVFVGSIRYAAPEQLDRSRGSIGPHTDLHGLGVMLYELATGRHPYGGEGIAEITTRVLGSEPARVGVRNPRVSAFFEEVVHRLMAKAPGERFGSAREVHEVLAAGEASDWWTERSREMRETTSRPLRRIGVPRETGVHGRERELDALRRLYASADAGEGRVVLIQGEAGIGKSRLMDEFVAGLRREGEEPRTLFGSCPPIATTSAAGALSMAFRDHFGESALESALQVRLGETPLLVPAFAALLRGEPTPPGKSPIAGDAVHTLFVNLTRALARERTTVLIVDDLHFTSEEGRGLFTSLALAAADSRLLLIGTARRELDEEWAAEIGREPHAARMDLERLDLAQMENLLAESLGGGTLAAELAPDVLRKSGGNPYFAFEIVKGLKDSDALHHDESGGWTAVDLIARVEIPSTVTELILARIRSLPSEDRELLDAAACGGFDFDPALLAETLGLAPVPVLRHLARIERRHRLLRCAGARFVFDHHLVRETLYGALPPALRTAYHAAFGDALLARHAETPPDGAAATELCSHLLRGGRGEPALPHIPAALSHLEATDRRSDAIELIEFALEPGDFLPEEERTRLLIRAAHLHGALGHREEEGLAIRDAAARADALGDVSLQLSSRRRLVWHHWSLARYDEARVAGREALEFARRSGDRSAEATAFGEAGGIGNETGDFAEAFAAYEHQAEVGRELGERVTELVGIANSGLSLQYLGRFAAALDRFEVSLKISRELDSRMMIGLAMLNLGRLEALLGDPDRGRERLEECLPIHRSIGERRPESYALHRLGEVSEQTGDREAAERLYRAALQLRRTIRYPSGIAETLVALGRLLLAAGRTAEAGETLSEAVELARSVHLHGEAVLASCHLARLPAFDPEAARAALAEFGDRMRFTDRMEGTFALHRALGEIEYLDEARALLAHLLDHAPPDRRDAVRENVPIVREILSAGRSGEDRP